MDKQTETAALSAVASTLDCGGNGLPKSNYTISVAVPKDHPALSNQADVSVKATISFVADDRQPLVVALQPNDNKEQSAGILSFTGIVDIAKSDAVARVLHHVNGEEAGILTVDPAFNDDTSDDDCASDGQTDSGVQSVGGPVSALKRLGQMDSADSSCMDLTLSDIQRVSSSQPLDSANELILAQPPSDEIPDAFDAPPESQVPVATSADHIDADTSQPPAVATIDNETATSASADPAPAEVSTTSDPHSDTVQLDKLSGPTHTPTDVVFPVEQTAPICAEDNSEAALPVSLETTAEGEPVQVENEHVSDSNSAGSHPSMDTHTVDQSSAAVEGPALETESVAEQEPVVGCPQADEPRSTTQLVAADFVVVKDDGPKAPGDAATSESADIIGSEDEQPGMADVVATSASEQPPVNEIASKETQSVERIAEEDKEDATSEAVAEPATEEGSGVDAFADSGILEEPSAKAVSELADVDSAVTDVKVDAQLPDTVDEPAVSENAEENKADLTIAAAETPIPEEAPVDSAIPDGTGDEVFVSEVLSASVEPSAEQPDVDSGVVEDDRPDVSDVATTEDLVAESANPESFTDEPSVEIADDSASDTKEQAVEEDVPASSLAVDDSSPATPAAQEHLADDNEPSTETRSVEMPAATDSAEASAAVEETSESAVTKKDIQESEVAVDSAPGVEETAAEHIPATEEPTVIAAQVVIDQTAEDSSEAPAAEEISEAGAVEKEADFQQPANAETAADESSEPAAADPVSDQAQVVDQPSEQPPVEAVSESEEQAVDPCSVDEVAAPDATPVSVPSISAPSVADGSVAPVVVGNDIDAPAAASDEPVVSAAVDVSADEEFQEDTAEPALDVGEPSANAQSNEEPAAEEVAVEEKDDAPTAVDERLDTNPGEVSVETESAVKEKASETEEVPASSSIEDGPEPETTDDASSASVHMPVVDTPEDIPTSDSQTVEQTVPDEPVADESSTSAVPDEAVADEALVADVPDESVADEYPIAAIPDEVAPSAPAVEESAKSSAQDVSERSTGEEVLVVEKAACAPDVEERTVEPPSEEEAAAPEPEAEAEAVVAPVVEEELAASTSVDDAVPSSQGTVEPSDGAPEPTDVEIPVGDEVIPEDAVTTESSQPELAIEEQNDIVVESLDNVDSTKEIAEPESAADDMFEEQPTTSTGHVDSSDADAVEADRPVPGESNVVVDTPVAEIPTESAALLNDAPVLDVSEESETPAELSDVTEHMAATGFIPVLATDVVADELAEPSVDSRDVKASVPTPDLEEQAPSAPDVEESAVEPIGVVASAEAEKPADIANDQPSDEAAETSIDESPADAPAAEQTVSADHTADEQAPSDSMVQEESLLPAAEEAPAPSADDVSQEEDVSERLESDDPATENDTPLPGSNDEAVLVKDALTVEEPSATEVVVEEPVSEAQAAESADADQTPPPTTDSDVVAVDDKPSVGDSVPMADIQPVTAPDSEPNADNDALAAEESVPEQVEREDLVSECATRDTEPDTAVDNEPAPVSDEAVVVDMAVDETIVEESASLPTVEADTTAVVEEFDAQEPAAEEPVAEGPSAEDPVNAPPAVEETVSLSDTEEDAVPNAAEESVALEEINEVPIPEEPAAKVESAAETVHLSNADIPAIEGQASAELVGDSARSLDEISVALTTDEPVEVPVIAELAETPEPESVEPVFESLQAAEPTTAVPIAEKVETPEPAIEEPVAEEPAVEEMAETPELVSVEPVLESLQATEPTTTVSTTDEVEAPVLATEDPVVEEPIVEELAETPEPTSAEPVIESLQVDEQSITAAPIAEEVASSESATEEPSAEKQQVEEPAAEDPTASPAAKGDALPAEPANEEPLPDIAAPSVGSESNVPVEVEEPEGAEAKGPANIDSEPNMVVVPDASTADDDTTPVAEEPEFAVPTVEEPIPSDALQTLDEPAIASVVEGEKIEAPVATSIEPGEIVPYNETSTSAEAADSQTPPAVDADAPISVDTVDSLAEDASPAIQEESGVVEEPGADANDFVIVDDSTNVSELSDREPIADTLEASPVVSLETEEEPEPAAAIADDNIAAAPEPDLVEPPVVDGDDADRKIPLEEPVAGASESANEAIDEPADPPAATEESALSEPVVGDFELAPVSEHDSDSKADAVEDAAPENLPYVDDSQNAQDPVEEEALPVVIDSTTEDQDVESAPAADLLAPESTSVEAQAAEDEVTEDKLVDSEDLDTGSPDADVVIVSGDPIRDEPAAIVEPANVSVAETDAPEPPSETQALDDVAAFSSPLREPVSREIGTDAANVETPVLEEPADVSAPGDAPEHVDTAIAISNAEPVDPASSAGPEQREGLEMSSGLEPVAEQQLIEEVEVASAPRDLDVVEGSEDKPATEEASTLSDYATVSVEEPVVVAAAAAAASEAANVAAPVDDALSTGQTTAEPVSKEPAVAERSIDEEIGTVDVPPASTTDTEEAAAKEPVEIASIAPEDASAEPSSEGPVVDTLATDEAAPNTAIAEDTVPVQSSSADVAEQVRVPGATEDELGTAEAEMVAPTESDVEVAKQPLEIEHNTPLAVDDAMSNEVCCLADEEIITSDQIDSEPVTAVEARDPAIADTPVANNDSDKEVTPTDSEPLTPVVEEAAVSKEKLDVPSDARESAEVVSARSESQTPDEPVSAPKKDALEPRSESGTALEEMPESTVTENALSAELETEKPGNVSDVIEKALDAVVISSNEPLADEPAADVATNVSTLPTSVTDDTDPVATSDCATVQGLSKSIVAVGLVEESEVVTYAERTVLDSSIPEPTEPGIPVSEAPAEAGETMVARSIDEESAVEEPVAESSSLQEAAEVNRSDVADDSTAAESTSTESLPGGSQDVSDTLAGPLIGIDMSIEDSVPEVVASETVEETSGVDPVLATDEPTKNESAGDTESVEKHAAVEEQPDVSDPIAEMPVVEISTYTEPTEEDTTNASAAAVADPAVVDGSIASTASDNLTTELVLEEPAIEQPNSNSVAASPVIEEPAVESSIQSVAAEATGELKEEISGVLVKELEDDETPVADETVEVTVSDEVPEINAPAIEEPVVTESDMDAAETVSSLRPAGEQIAVAVPTDIDNPEANIEIENSVKGNVDSAVVDEKVGAKDIPAPVPADVELVAGHIVNNEEPSETEMAIPEPIAESADEPAVEPIVEPIAELAVKPIPEPVAEASKPVVESTAVAEESVSVCEHTAQEEASNVAIDAAEEQAALDTVAFKPSEVEPVSSDRSVAVPVDTQPAPSEAAADANREQGADTSTLPVSAKMASGGDSAQAQRSYDEVDSVMYPTVSESRTTVRPAKLDTSENGAYETDTPPAGQDSAVATTPSYVMHYPESLFGDTASITPGIITIEELHAAQKAAAVVGVSAISATTAGRRSRDSGFHGSDGGDFTVGQRMKRFISGKRDKSPRGRTSTDLDSRDTPTSPKSIVSGILADTREKLSSQHRASRGSYDGKRISGAPSATVIDDDEDLKHASLSIPGSFPSEQAVGRHSESEAAAHVDPEALQDESPLSSEGEGASKDKHRRHTILGVIKRMFR